MCFLSIFYRFEFVKSVGSSITQLKLPQGQEANAKVIRHTSGAGPIYIRSLSKLEIDEVPKKMQIVVVTFHST